MQIQLVVRIGKIQRVLASAKLMCEWLLLTLITGPALGSALFVAGGFTLPYVVVASSAFLVAIILAIVVPKVSIDEKSKCQTKSVGFLAILKVQRLFLFLC